MKNTLLSVALIFAAIETILLILWMVKAVALADIQTPLIVTVAGVSLFGIIAVVLAAIKGVTKLNTSK